MRWIAVALLALALVAATAAAVTADAAWAGGPPITADGKGWCRDC